MSNPNCSRCFSSSNMLKGLSSLKQIYACEKKKHRPVSYGEFLHWLGLWFLMSTINGPDRPGFWSMGEVDCFIGALLRLGSFMSRKQFEVILKALAITARQPPALRDGFWEVQEILEAWNANMTEQFTPSWVSCLDESMSTWTNKYSCPGWMFVPRKLWPFGNEYHTVCCSLSGILWQMELVEGKDSPSAYNLSDMLSKHWDHPTVYPMILKLLINRDNITLIPRAATQEKEKEISNPQQKKIEKNEKEN